jgi:aspartyl-tRNA(Asn)/glutamyl-tRNA(Gln) amidotransferase subunit A
MGIASSLRSSRNDSAALMTDLAFTSAAELARLIAGRAVSPVEVVDGVLDRIERAQPVLNAFITVCVEEARAAAREAEAAVMRGDTLGPLHGVPFAVKDLVNTKGVRTTFGSVILADNIPAADSPAVARLKAAGAILVGKTTTPEFGHKCFTEAPLFGRTANPCRAHPAGRQAARRRRSRPASRPLASAPMAAGRAVSRRRAAASSASSRPWAWCRTT